MVAFAGLRGTGNWGPEERPTNYREGILFMEPNGRAPITGLTSKMRSSSVDDPKFNWFEETLRPLRLQVSGAVPEASSTIRVNGGALNLVPGDTLLVEGDLVNSNGAFVYNSEILDVLSVTDDFNFTVRRGSSGTTPLTGDDSIAADGFLSRIGSSHPEGSRSPQVASTNPEPYFNYCQIFKTAYEITNTAKLTRVRTGDTLKNEKRRKMFTHSVARENSILFGNKAITNGSNGQAKRYTGGLLHFLAAGNVEYPHTIQLWNKAIDEGGLGSPSVNRFFDSVYKVFDYTASDGGTSSERIVFAGNGWLNTLNKLAKGDRNSQINYDGIVKVYGMELMRWILPQGTLLIKSHPLLNVHDKYQYSCFIIDPASLHFKYMSGRDGMMMDNIQENDADTQKGQWLSECGLEFSHVNTMQYQENFF